MSIGVRAPYLGVHIPPGVDSSTSYSNPGGTGDRVRYIIATTNLAKSATSVSMDRLVNGGFAASAADSYAFQTGQGGSSKFIRFQFADAQIVNEARWYQDVSNTHGIWQWQGSNDGSSWTNIGASFTLGGTLQTQTELSGNTTRYFYYQLVGVSGSTSVTPWIKEVEFKISLTNRTNGCVYVTGNRTSTIAVSASSGLLHATTTASKLVDGSFTADATGSVYFNPILGVAGRWIQFDFGTAKLIDEAAWYQDITDTQGVWQWQGSADASGWTNIGSSFTLGTSAYRLSLHLELHSNTTSYRYYRLLGISGTTSSNSWLQEIEFRIA